MENPEFVAGLERIPVDRKEHPEFHLAELYEEIGSFVRSGLIDEKLFLQGHWYNVLLYWKLLQTAVAVGRKHRPYIFENFEYLARRANRWVEAHPGGDYPSSERRLLPTVETSPDA